MIGDGYGEYAAVPAVQCLPVPPGVGLVDAGGLPETFCTVWTNVFERMHLQPGETFLIQGGSSGIGVTAIQLAKAWGCKVLATAGSDAKCAACREFGADVAINYRTQDFVAVGKEFTGGRGVDAILDMVGGDYIPRQIDLLAHEGRLCFVALMGGTKVEADFGAIQRKHLTITGSTLRSRSVAQKAAIIAALREKVWPMWAQGKLRPFTYRQFPLREAATAHRADGVERAHRQDPAGALNGTPVAGEGPVICELRTGLSADPDGTKQADGGLKRHSRAKPALAKAGAGTPGEVRAVALGPRCRGDDAAAGAPMAQKLLE